MPGYNDAETDQANSLHASALCSEYNERETTKHLAKKFERVFLTHVRQDGWEIAFCLRNFLLVNAF